MLLDMIADGFTGLRIDCSGDRSTVESYECQDHRCESAGDKKGDEGWWDRLEENP